MTQIIWEERARVAIQAAVPALDRTLEADKSRDKVSTAISAVETTLWIRALNDAYEKFAPAENKTDSQKSSVPHPPFRNADPRRTEYAMYQKSQGLRLVTNKGIHEMIFPTSENMRYDFFKIGRISPNHTYQWRPLSEWKEDILEQRRADEKLGEHYAESVAGHSVVPTLAQAISSFHDRAVRMNLDLTEAFTDFDKQIRRYF